MTRQLEFRWDEIPLTPKPRRPSAPRQAGEMRQAQTDALHAELMRHHGGRFHLRITDNTSTIMSIKQDAKGTLVLRLHHMFLDAPPEIRRALAQWMKRPRSKQPGDLLNEYIRQRRHLIKRAAPRQVCIRTRGERFDLQRLFDELNHKYFDGKIGVPITWGRMPAARRRRSIRFGSYSPDDRVIRIHPLLDTEFVPRFFIRYIVFHEMLHALLGIGELPNGRRSVHSPEFKTMEKGYPDYKRAVAWMEDPANLRRILNAPPPHGSRTKK